MESDSSHILPTECAPQLPQYTSSLSVPPVRQLWKHTNITKYVKNTNDDLDDEEIVSDPEPCPHPPAAVTENPEERFELP